MTKRYYPRGGANYLNRHAKTLLASALILAFNSAQAIVLTPPQNIVDWKGHPGEWYTNENDDEINQFRLIDGTSASFDGVDAEISPLITNSEFFVSVENKSSLTITGTTKVTSISTEESDKNDRGTYTFRATDGYIHFKGNVDVIVTHHPDVSTKEIGANIYYAQNDGTIEIGDKGTTTKSWVIAAKPDLISAKRGGTVKIKSTHNMLVGSVDMVQKPERLEDIPKIKAGSVTGTFSGEDSYWFGDEQSFNNISKELVDILKNSPIASTIDKILSDEEFSFTFQKGAQWTYLDAFNVEAGGYFPFISGPLFENKRISKITLLDGGIINLFDKDIKEKLTKIGLWNLLNIDENTLHHDYVRIGDLKGNNGIFRLDLNSDDRTQSDMIFIEGASEGGGRHWIEPYSPSQLVSVSANNTLTFALTQKDANTVTFADKMNIYGETLYDYELYVNSDTIDKKDLARLAEQIKSNYTDFGEFDDDDSSADQSYREDYLGGTEWFIERVVVSKSAATIGVNNASWAAYDAIMQMDRRDRRLRETSFVDDATNDGLWVRMQYGRLGAEDAYKSDTTTVHVGYERQTSDNNRFGVSVSYMDGSPDFENLKGGGDLERYEIAVYDTLTFGNHYLDFVGRFGHLSSDFSSSRSASSISTQGEFSTNYFGVSAEYGYTLKSVAGFFAEPQLQMQATRLEGYNYGLQRDMSVDVEQETALVGRAGLRLGKRFAGERSSGEIYVRGDLLHQFTDGQFGHIRDLEDVESLHWGDAGTWTNFGVGGYYQFANKFSMQLDLEKSAGGEQLDAWMVSGHLVYNF